MVMARLNLIIADKDSIYAEKISRYLLEKSKKFNTDIVTEIEYLYPYITNKNVDMFLIDESMLSTQLIEKLQGFAVGVLTGGSFKESLSSFKYINKFQKTEKIISEILLIYAETSGNSAAILTENKKTKLVAVYSPVGGCGKTVLSLALSGLVASQFAKVLYFNLEKNNSSFSYLEKGNSTFAEVMLATKNKAGNIALSVQKAKLQDNASKVYYFAPAESALDFNDLTVDEYTRLIGAVAEMGEFDFVFFDLPSEFTNVSIQILSMMDKVIVPLVASSTSIEKQKNFFREKELHTSLNNIYDKSILLPNQHNNSVDTRTIYQALASVLDGKNLLREIPYMTQLNMTTCLAELCEYMRGHLDSCIEQISGQ